MTFPKASLGAAVLLVALSSLYLVQAFTLEDSGVSTSGTSPLAYPLVVGVPMAILSLVLLIIGLADLRKKSPSASVVSYPSSKRSDETDDPDGENKQADAPVFRIEAPILFGFTLVHVLLLPLWGYLIGTTVYTFFAVLVVQGDYRPNVAKILRTILFSLGIAAATYAGFELGLGLSLPQGMLELGVF